MLANKLVMCHVHRRKWSFFFIAYMEHSIKRLARHLEPWPFLHDTQVTQLDHLPLLGMALLLLST
jgi:hypothetical protein